MLLIKINSIITEGRGSCTAKVLRALVQFTKLLRDLVALKKGRWGRVSTAPPQHSCALSWEFLVWSSHIISSRAWFCPSHQTWGENDCPIVAWFICTLLDPAVWSPLGAQPFGKSQSHSPVFYPSTVLQLSRHSPCLWGQLRDSQRARQCSQH